MERIEQLQIELQAVRRERAQVRSKLHDVEERAKRLTKELEEAEDAAALLKCFVHVHLDNTYERNMS